MLEPTTAKSRTTTPIPPENTATAHSSSVAISSATPSPSPRQNDEVTRGIFNLKMVVFLILLPLILFAAFLKHLLDYLFSLGLKEKDVSGKVALVSLYLINACKYEIFVFSECRIKNNVYYFKNRKNIYILMYMHMSV